MDDRIKTALLDSMKDPVLFADLDHVVRYMNKPAIAHYEQGEALLGSSLFDCHNDNSQRMIVEIADAMKAGEEERLIRDDEVTRIFMRAVRDERGVLLGYYERYEPPIRSGATDEPACPGPDAGA